MLKRSIRIATLCLLSAAILLQPATAADLEDNWPNWRGPLATGVAAKGDPPVRWSETENIQWKIALPGKSSSTPVVWGNKLFIQTAIPTVDEPEPVPQPRGRRRGPPRGPTPTAPYKFDVVCIDRTNGAILWQKTAREETPHEGVHPTNSHASYSPVTDGEKLWVSFGSRGLYCYDLDGELQWHRDLISMRTRNRFGEGSSPALAGDAVVVLMDHEGDSKILAFNKDTGEPLWERNRAEVTSWSTPLAVTVGDRMEIITSATDRIRSYDAKTGDLIWHCDGLTVNAIPTPVLGFGNVYCTSGYRGAALKAIELGHTGDLSDTDAIKWEVDRGTPYVASPLLYGDRIYITSSLRPRLSCYDAVTGKAFFVEENLEGLGQIYASPVGAAGRVYIPDREGAVMVIQKSDALDVITTNTLDDGFDASPVIIGNTIYLKGNKNLYCIAKS